MAVSVGAAALAPRGPAANNGGMDTNQRYFQLSLRTLLEVVAIAAVVLVLIYQGPQPHGRFQVIPLQQLSDNTGVIQCTGCGTHFDESVIHAVGPNQESTWECPKCSRKWPETNVRCPICKVRPSGAPA